jgi:L-fuconolactonase
MIIDSHQHFWKYNSDEFAWIDESMEKIQKDFLPEDLASIFSETGVDGSVAVQARQKTEETSWLLELSVEYEWIRGLIGWVPLTEIDVSKHLDRYSLSGKMKGVRHVVHDEPDDQFILRDDFNLGITQIRQYELVYDILIFEKHLPQTIQFVDRHPNQLFVLDHIGKPMIQEGLDTPWRKNIQKLARRENVYCKLSGIVTEADYEHWTESQIEPYMEIVVDAFWPKRVMFGSDWPVCTVAAEYKEWLDIVLGYLDSFSENERDRILSGTAIEAYDL